MVSFRLSLLGPWCLVALLSTLVVASPAAVEGKTRGKVAAAWYAGWHATTGYPLSRVSWKKYTHLTYAFAETSPDVHKLSFEEATWTNPQLLPQFVSEAHKHGVKALISIGGWTGSRFFSTAVGSASNRTAFVKTVVNFAQKYHLDGVDFDWEYPGNQGIGCNTINPQDTSNFLLFLQELRRDPVGSKLLVTAAAATVPFYGSNGRPSSDVAAFAKLLDYIAIMNYDLWGPWSPTVGPNAPLDDACAPANSRYGSATSAVRQWSAAGIPHNQLVLGVAAYGHGFRVRRANAFAAGSNSVLASYPPFDGVDRPIGDSWDGPGGGTDVCGSPTLPGGTFNFWGLIENGFLNKDGSPTQGIHYRYDTCSQTPYVYNRTTEIMVAFDNAQSFAAKGNFIKSNGLRGFATWEAGGDYNDILLDSIRKAGGY
ncbi:endochitinase [Coprinopsis cinerea okayama7|uniref:Endochitinase n=1 Tax=Coprinopsis cinerea (strain Okayama-7 / 130 / ATCC MYA-4618 / FGSC 9003) TaxID=240176 RepID=A8NYD9_COPC7|nr:endochitinase [Coprinopsis cinerea okayama7\|eukprot:XP_001837403.1 endochitinase [Coprinopsis cinerea okayama7\